MKSEGAAIVAARGLQVKTRASAGLRERRMRRHRLGRDECNRRRAQSLWKTRNPLAGIRTSIRPWLAGIAMPRFPTLPPP
jgi:hypothetical protein